MKKDSKDSPKQKRWEFALKMHESYSSSLVFRLAAQKISPNPESWQPHIEYTKQQIAKLEKEFPALKDITYPTH